MPSVVLVGPQDSKHDLGAALREAGVRGRRGVAPRRRERGQQVGLLNGQGAFRMNTSVATDINVFAGTMIQLRSVP